MAGLNELAAVNLILGNIGETPVSSLAGSAGDAYVSTALNTLNEVARTVQEEGWEFNTDSNYPLTPDISDYIVIADNMVSVDTMPGGINVTVRQGKLYNKTDRTFTFTDALDCEVVWEFDFIDTPQYIRQYIAVRAARVFADRQQGDQIADALSQDDEARALRTAKRHDLRNADRTMFDTSNNLGRLQTRRI